MGWYEEVCDAPKDIKLLWISVFLRLLAYGITNQVLTLFLSSIGIPDDQIGLFMSLTLFGDVFCSYFLTWYADAIGRKKVLIFGSVMMVLSGLVFSISENFHVLLLFAIFGVISPSSNEVGPFKSIEESMIAHLTPHKKRPEIYSIHAFTGIIGSALGALVSGSVVQYLKDSGIASTDLECYKLVFFIYSILAFGKVVTMVLLSAESESTDYVVSATPSTDALETDALIPVITSESNRQSPSKSLSKETKSVLYKLLIIFMIDSTGAGFMTDSWMVYYYARTFLMSSFALGMLFFICQIIMAASTVPSSNFARKFGPVRATLLVQIPAGLFSIMIPLFESYLPISIVFLALHYSTLYMDVTPRQLILTNIINPNDLTRVMGIVNIGKTFARCVGPIFTGKLAKAGYLWLCYIISGALVILADFILASWFLHIDADILKQIS